MLSKYQQMLASISDDYKCDYLEFKFNYRIFPFYRRGVNNFKSDSGRRLVGGGVNWKAALIFSKNFNFLKNLKTKKKMFSSAGTSTCVIILVHFLFNMMTVYNEDHCIYIFKSICEVALSIFGVCFPTTSFESSWVYM